MVNLSPENETIDDKDVQTITQTLCVRFTKQLAASLPKNTPKKSASMNFTTSPSHRNEILSKPNPWENERETDRM